MKVVYDTCLYIDLLRDGRRLELFQDRSHIRFLSPIVVMELNAGCRTGKQRAVVDRLYAPYSNAGRVLRPENDLFYRAGHVLAKLRGQGEPRKLANDVLIALGAKSVGACLFTSNKKDFETIRRHVDFRLGII